MNSITFISIRYTWLITCLSIQALAAQELAWPAITIGPKREGFLPIELTVSNSENLVFGLQSSSDLLSWQEEADQWVVLERSDSGFQRVGFLARSDAEHPFGFMRIRVDLNSPPVAADDYLVLTKVMREHSLAIFQNDFDSDNDVLTLVEYREPDHGTLAQRNGDLFYTPLANFSGRDRFEYTIRDHHGAVSSGTVNLLVPAQDDADADELPNDWEVLYHLDPNDPSDALGDPDADGYPNLYEFHHQSDPTDPYDTPKPTYIANTTSQIEQGLLIAMPFDIIAMAAGSYSGGNWELPGPNHPIMLVAQLGPGTAIIELGGEEMPRAFNFDARQDQRSVISGLTFRDGIRTLGSGIRFVDNASATLIDCRFVDCQSQNAGGAVYIRDAAPIFLRCSFENNQAGSFAGAVYATGAQTRVSFFQCEFTDNLASTDGGALYFTDNAFAEIQDCQFHRNEALGNGGAAAFNQASHGTVMRSFFTHNASDGHGGAISCRVAAYPDISHSVIARNTSKGRGGGLYAGNKALPKLVHCTLSDNEASSGGGVYHYLTSPVVIRHSILWDNEPQQLLANGGEDIANSIILGGRQGNENFASDPLLIPDGVGRYRLRAESPARDLAPQSTSTDIDGERSSSLPDLGADEFVDGDLDGLPDHWERQVGLNPTLADAELDLDQDGNHNLHAYLSGTDPAAALPSTISVQGEIQAVGIAPIRILLVTAPDSWQPYKEVSTIPSEPTFQIEAIPRREQFWVLAYHDLNGNRKREFCEPTTAHQALDTRGSVANLTLTLPLPDREPPTLSGIPVDLSVTRLEDVPPIAQVSAQDQGQPIEVTVEESLFKPETPNEIHRRWTAHDACGNTVTASQIIRVVGPGQETIGTFLTSFEPGQGYAPGPLSGQDGWSTSSKEGVQVINQKSTQTNQHVVSLIEARAKAQRLFAISKATTIDLTFSLYLDAASGQPPSMETLPSVASAIVSYDASRGLVALDGDGLGHGDWVLIPNTKLPNQWIQIRILKDDETATWSLDFNGERVLSNLGYKNNSSTGLSRLRVTNGDDGTASIDNLVLTHQ